MYNGFYTQLIRLHKVDSYLVIQSYLTDKIVWIAFIINRILTFSNGKSNFHGVFGNEGLLLNLPSCKTGNLGDDAIIHLDMIYEFGGVLLFK